MDVPRIRMAQSCALDSAQAVREFHASVAQPDAELVVFFCSSEYDLDVLASEMRRLFAGIHVVGCTTAGEIGPVGYRQHSLTGMSFPSASCVTTSGLLDQLSRFDIAKGRDFTQNLLQQLESRAPGASSKSSFALLLIDGMSVREEPVAYAMQSALGNIMMFGGSAGDDMKFSGTWVYRDGGFHADSALLVLVSTTLPFRIFKTQHFVPGNERMVVTEADPARRMVFEINGLPAAAEYARLVGIDSDNLNPLRFAASPVVVIMDGTDYVRAIQTANDDGSLTFYSAIETGLVLRVAHGVDLANNLEQTFDRIREEIGPPQIVLGCDCILRNLEASMDGKKQRIGDIFRRNNTIGFSSYGEQFHGIHVNQTFTGCAVGSVTQDV